MGLNNNKELQNYSTIKVQRDDFAKNINRETQPPPHAVLFFSKNRSPPLLFQDPANKFYQKSETKSLT
jgi:hypothetical protein